MRLSWLPSLQSLSLSYPWWFLAPFPTSLFIFSIYYHPEHCTFYLFCVMVDFTCQFDWGWNAWGAIKLYFWECLWGCFQNALAFELGDWVKQSPQCGRASSKSLRVWTEQKGRGKLNSLFLTDERGRGYSSALELLALKPFSLRLASTPSALWLSGPSTTSFPGCPVCRLEIVELLNPIITWANAFMYKLLVLFLWGTLPCTSFVMYLF